MNRNEKINTIKEIISSIETNLNYIENINDYNKISSFKDYIFSRIFDKLSTLGVNYIRVLSILDIIKISDCEEISANKKFSSKFKEEADVEITSGILRPLFELYLELKSFKLSLSKLDKEKVNDDAFELLMNLVYLEDRFSYDEMKLNVSKDFYNSEPLYYKQSSNNNKKEINNFRIKLSQKNLPLLKNTRNKLLDVVKHNNKKERVLLGLDYLTSYAFLSKKTHFSYSNIIGGSMNPKMMLDWSLLLFVGIYGDISILLKFEDKITAHFSDIFETLNSDIKTESLNVSTIGNIAVFDFGIGKIIGKENLNLNIKYIASNNFERDTVDIVPKIFMQKEVKENDFLKIHEKYYKEFKQIYNDMNYEKMYLDLMKL